MSAHRPSFQPKRRSKSFLKGAYDGSVGSCVLSPAVSAGGGSATVTPITPGTPMSTPVTPLQILLGRHNFRGVGGPYKRPSSPPQHQNNVLGSDAEEEDQFREKELFALQLLANFLNNVETTLNYVIERENAGHQVLGPAIVRMCRDLADEIEGLAKDLNREHEHAAEHLERVRSELKLSLIEECVSHEVEEKSNSEAVAATNEAAYALSSLVLSEDGSSLQSHEKFISTLSTTHTLLLDMAAALRAISQQEAQELGEVGLEVARMLVWSLGMVHSNMIQIADKDVQHTKSSEGKDDETQKANDSPHNMVAGSIKKNRVTWSDKNTKSHGFGPVVEILEEKEDEHAPIYPSTPNKDMLADQRCNPRQSPISSSPQEPTFPILPRNASSDRIRVLWPRLTSMITEASKHAASNAKEYPIPAVAIGLACGPAAIATAAIAGPPLLVADWAIQSSYDALSDHTPVIENVEKGAANALQVARLLVLCSKLVVKQGISVGERQIERRGGVRKVCSGIVGGAMDMALHPADTVGAAWGGLFRMGGAVRDAVIFVKDTMSGGDLGMDIQ